MTTFRQHRLQSFLQGYEDRARLLISCPDRPGIVAAVTSFLYEQGANIVESSQYSTDPKGGTFFLRLEFDCPNITERKDQIEAAFAPIAAEFQMRWQLRLHNDIRRIAIFVSKAEHCLLELLWQWQAGELIADIALVISNHPDLRETVESFGIPYVHIPVTKETKADAEAEQIRLLRDYQIDTIVLARYMQILSADFVKRYPQRIINIHHSFLPAFIGARPYHRAFERGVKLIGATSHYVTEVLDEGPIIEQDIDRISHRDQVEDLIQKGRDLERIVLSRAVRWHIENRILPYANKTVIFD